MKKMITAAAALLLTVPMLHAQMTVNPEVGMNVTNLNYHNEEWDYGNKTGIRLGASFNLPLSKGFFLQPGLFYSVKGAHIVNNSLDNYYRFEGNERINYLEFPVNLGYQYKLGKLGSLFAIAGPYLGFGLSASLKGEDWIDGNHNANPNQNGKIPFYGSRLDAGFNFGLGYKLPFGLFVKGQYNLGLTKVTTGPSTEIKNRGYSFSLGYELKLPSKAKNQK